MTLKSFWKIFCMFLWVLVSQKIWNFVRQSGMLYVFESLSVRQSGICIFLWVWVRQSEIWYVFESLNVRQSGILCRFVILSVRQSGSFVCFWESEWSFCIFCEFKWNFYMFLSVWVKQSGMMYVFVRLSGAFVCFYESECEIKWNFVRQSGTLYVFESLSVRQSGIL